MSPFVSPKGNDPKQGGESPPEVAEVRERRCRFGRYSTEPIERIVAKQRSDRETSGRAHIENHKVFGRKTEKGQNGIRKVPRGLQYISQRGDSHFEQCCGKGEYGGKYVCFKIE